MALDFYLDPADVRAFQADVWAQPHLRQLGDDWETAALAKLSAPAPPDPGLAAHLGGATPPPIEQSAGPETAMPAVPSPPDALPPAAPALPAPDAPLPTDYGPVPTSPQRQPIPTAPAAPTPTPSPVGDLVSYARQAAQKAGIDPDLFTRQINQESGFNPNAGSPAGARGIAQIVPKYHPGVDVTDPYASLDYAANLMANLVKQHGGDVRTALVAYNGGQGAVNALNAGTPYAESKQYVQRILGGSTPAPSAAASTAPAGDLSLSQFGDKTLTADEAYAACGPAAAARLASEYGNAIPLSVALQAAKAVGWTPGAGMAGIASEKKLMDALGLPAELDTSGDWGRITSAAGSGSLVTISTPMHYFSANGTRQRPDGQTELYVGQSGMDLKAGKAWMTPAEIEAVAGKMQGALFSDPSRAVMAGDWHQKVINREGLPPPTPDQPLAELTQAAQKAGVQRPDETISNPFGEAFRQVGNAAGQVGGALGEAAQGAFKAAFPVQSLTPEQYQAQVLKASQSVRPPSNALEAFGSAGLGAPTGGEQVSAEQNQWIAENNPLRDVPVVGGATTLAGQAIADPTNLLLAGPGIGKAGAAAAREAGPALEAAAPAVRGFLRDESGELRIPGDNPFALHTEPGPGRVPLGEDDIASHLESLGAQYEANDARIQELENQIHGGSLKPGASGVQRPPWAAGITNDALRQIAADHGVQATTERWWEHVGLLTGSGEVRENVRQGGYTGLGRTQQTPAQARAELARLIAENDQIMAATEVPEGATTLYRPAAQTAEDLPWTPYTQPPEVATSAPTGIPAQAVSTGANQGGAGANPALAPGSAGAPPPSTGPVAQPLTPPGGPTRGSTAYRTLLNMYGDVKTSPFGAIPSQLEEARRTVVRKWTDRGIDLAEFQKDAQRAAGRPLTADEMAYEMRRVNPSGAASMRVQNELKPAIQSVGQDVGPLKVYLTAKDNLDVAAAMGNKDRSFSGGLSAADSQAALDHMAQEIGPDRMAKVEQAGQQIIDYGRSLLQRKVDAGLISQDLYDQLTTKYPNYSPTRIVDYLKDPAGIPSGRKITVQSAGLKSNTVEGTVRQREDPLASFVRLGYETEALATKNEVAQAFLKLRDLNPDTAMMIRKVADDVPNPRGFEKMKVFENGVPQTYQMPDYIAKAIKEEPVLPIPILAPMMNLFRALATQRNPLFLASNALNDAVSYTIRSSSRLGGPQNIPKVATELVKAYGDAFQGILKAEYHGNTARYMEGGGAMSGFFSHSPEQAQKLANELQLPHVFAVRSDHALEDVKRLIGQALLLKPVEAIGERIELAPRVAAMRLAEKAGATQQQAVLAGRTVTLDFSQGGTWAKTLNQYIPFFNTAMQAAATPVRAFSENPRGFIATATSLLAAPTVGFEAWNRSDPQRAKDYADVPQYVKDQGLVFMLPAKPQVDAKGNRKPQYLFFPTREYSPFVTLTREAAGRAMGQNPRDWDLLLGTVKSVSPISGNSGADVLSSAVPLGVSTGMQLATDQDWFRGGHIMSQTADEQASAFSKAAADALQKMGIQARPSGVEFAVRDLAAGVGSTALAASDMVAGQPRRDSRVQSTPGVGGLIGRFVQDRTGQQLTNAIAQPVSPNVEKALNDAGIPTPTIPYTISVRSQMTGNQSPPIELRQQERAEYQRLMSERLNERLAPILADPSWAQRPIANRNKVLEAQVKAARDYAESKVYSAMAPEDRQARMQAGRLAQQPKPKP